MAKAPQNSNSSPAPKPPARRGRPAAQAEPKRWRIRGRSLDGTTVTLGRYDTEPEAITAREMRIKEGIFENIRVHAIKLDPEPESESEAGSAPASGTAPASDPKQKQK